MKPTIAKIDAQLPNFAKRRGTKLCPQCGKWISARCAVCPNCGLPFVPPRSRKAKASGNNRKHLLPVVEAAIKVGGFRALKKLISQLE